MIYLIYNYGFLTKSRAEVHQSMLNSSCDMIGLNMKFERACVLVLDNILGPSAVTHYYN